MSNNVDFRAPRAPWIAPLADTAQPMPPPEEQVAEAVRTLSRHHGAFPILQVAPGRGVMWLDEEVTLAFRVEHLPYLEAVVAMLKRSEIIASAPYPVAIAKRKRDPE